MWIRGRAQGVVTDDNACPLRAAGRMRRATPIEAGVSPVSAGSETDATESMWRGARSAMGEPSSKVLITRAHQVECVLRTRGSVLAIQTNGSNRPHSDNT